LAWPSSPTPRNDSTQLTTEDALAHQNKKKENVDTVDRKPEEEEDRPVWVYVDAMFDLFHLGHTCVLEQAKKL
jgi:bifunctional ADP-heptose synthase (sugar kinase/adenylyltransferase)